MPAATATRNSGTGRSQPWTISATRPAGPVPRRGPWARSPMGRPIIRSAASAGTRPRLRRVRRQAAADGVSLEAGEREPVVRPGGRISGEFQREVGRTRVAGQGSRRVRDLRPRRQCEGMALERDRRSALRRRRRVERSVLPGAEPRGATAARSTRNQRLPVRPRRVTSASRCADADRSPRCGAHGQTGGRRSLRGVQGALRVRSGASRRARGIHGRQRALARRTGVNRRGVPGTNGYRSTYCCRRTHRRLTRPSSGFPAATRSGCSPSAGISAARPARRFSALCPAAAGRSSCRSIKAHSSGSSASARCRRTTR